MYNFAILCDIKFGRYFLKTWNFETLIFICVFEVQIFVFLNLIFKRVINLKNKMDFETVLINCYTLKNRGAKRPYFLIWYSYWKAFQNLSCFSNLLPFWKSSLENQKFGLQKQKWKYDSPNFKISQNADQILYQTKF